MFPLGVSAVCYGEQGKKEVVSHKVPFGSADASRQLSKVLTR